MVRRAILEALETRVMFSVGGGWTDAGLEGAYFNNTSFAGTPAFTRKDVRIDFDWGTAVKPGGSNSTGFRDVGTDNYSIRWTGQLVGRFSESYTFKARADDSFVLELKAAGAGTWTTVINQAANTGTESIGAMALVAGQKYDVRISYRELTGSAGVQLKWASVGTPEEVIDPLVESGINNPDWTSGYTDIVKGARNRWESFNGGMAGQDANGWMTGDGLYYFQESLNEGLDFDPMMRGRLTFTFTGKATLRAAGNVADGSLSYSYNAGTNTTSGSFVTANKGSNASWIEFRNTTRTGIVGGPGGITNLRLMRPISVDSGTSYATDGSTIFTPELKDAMGHFTVIRHQYVANQQRDWSDRTLPGYFNQAAGSRTAPHLGVGETSDNGASWEYKIMLANETGRDLMISLPTLASDAYITNLANLLRYGSDANGTPYTAVTANPVHPPLNSNLHVYFELENELWNFASVFYTDFQNLNLMTAADIDARGADYAVLNYDNLPTTKDGNGEYTSMDVWRLRNAMLRTIQASNLFRGVFGDGAMPGTSASPRVRPLYEWQYDNLNDTARIALTWAENYFNNGDGQVHVATPRPVNYFIWGGGGASYYGAVNDSGLTDLPGNYSFDATTVANGYVQNPGGTGFVFGGTAGIARDAGAGDDIPTPLHGSQVGYIRDKGAISFTFTVPAGQTSSVYGLSFKAVNRTKLNAGSADRENIRIYLDGGIDITAKTFNQTNGYTPGGYEAGENAWKADNVFWMKSEYFFSKSFSLAAGSTHTITIQGMGDVETPSNTNQVTFFDDVRLTSVDRFFSDGIPADGQATGQEAGASLRNIVNTEANWAKAYGLEQVSYESGWSLGGDDGGSWLQLAAKYGDPRTADAQREFMRYFYQSGSAVNVFGTYAQWPSWRDSFAEQGLLNVGAYPIIQGIDAAANSLPDEPTNGVLGPVALRPVSASLSHRADRLGGTISEAGGWLNWSVIVPVTGTYRLKLTTAAGVGAAALVLADGAGVAYGASGAGTIDGDVVLTKGMHSLRVKANTPGSLTVKELVLVGLNPPEVPVLASAEAVEDSVALGWATVPGALGYRVRWGTSPGEHSGMVDVGAATSYTVAGLARNQAYYFAVSSYGAGGISLASNEKGVVIVEEEAPGKLAEWEFDGLAGGEASATGARGAMVNVSELTRGGGWNASASSWAAGLRANLFASEKNSYGGNLAQAIANNQYYTFSVSAKTGNKLSLQELSWLAYFQSPQSTSGMGITYSTDGVNYSSGIAATGNADEPTGKWRVNLAGIGALQNTTGTVTFRIYQFGAGNFTLLGLGNAEGTDLTLTGTWASTNIVPTGWVDGIFGSTVSGWAYDVDGAGGMSAVRVDIDGATFATLATNTLRSDVNAAFGLTENHGFAVELPAYAGAGNHAVSVYAVDLTTGKKGLMGTKTWAVVNASPEGWVDGISGNVFSGWAYDPDAKGDAISVLMIVDGVARETVATSGLRSDVNGAFGLTGIHGFAYELPGDLAAGTHVVEAWAVDSRSGLGTWIGTRSFVTSNPPRGSVDFADSGVLFGWAYDPDAAGSSGSVRVEIDGVTIATLAANLLRTDVNTAFGIAGNHGFMMTMPTLATGAHTVKVYALDAASGAKVLIGDVVVTV